MPRRKAVEIGDANRNKQVLTRKTDRRGNHPYARVWELRCDKCGHTYGANSCDFHLRLCPKEECQGGEPGL